MLAAAAELQCVAEEEAKKVMKVHKCLELMQLLIIQVTKMFPQITYSKVVLDNKNLKYKSTCTDTISDRFNTSQPYCVIAKIDYISAA